MDHVAETTPAAASTVFCKRWTDMWNRIVPATEVVTPDCRVYFGRKPQIARPTSTTGPHELQSMIDSIQERLPGIHYSVECLSRYQADSNTSGIITLLWNVAVPGQETRTGIDLLRREGDWITEVWSITGDLELPFMR
jgi:hypothetical protein